MNYSVTSNVADAWMNKLRAAWQSAPQIIGGSAGQRVEHASRTAVVRRETIAAVDALACCMLDAALGG